MLTHALETLLVLPLTVLFLGLLRGLGRFDDGPTSSKISQHGRWTFRPRTPDDCPHCRDVAAAPLAATARMVAPYVQRKSHRGRKKAIDTRGQACPNPDCDHRGVSDPAVHVLVGYGHHGSIDPIQDFYCQNYHHKSSARRHTTPLVYR
jgi:hypothetical protein